MQPIQQERHTETFRGVNCKKHARQYVANAARAGWRQESFSGVSGVGAFKTCSVTVVRP